MASKEYDKEETKLDQPLKDDHEEKKDFIDPETTFLIGAGAWWFFKTMVQAVAGWVGIQLFKRAWELFLKFTGLQALYDRWVKRWFGKGKDDDKGEGSSKTISEEESAAASYRALHRGCDGGRVFPSESESDQS